MAQVDLTIDQLLLDDENPRINSAPSQREALRKIIADEPEKFVVLARSIASKGLNPMDRLLVYRRSGKYVALEGNRRVAALKILSNPSSLGSLSVPDRTRRQLEGAAGNFSPEKVEPIACFDVGRRANARSWLEQRHTGENKGEGIVAWKSTAQARFRGGEPALEVLDFVRTQGGLSPSEIDKIDSQRFSLTTLQRLVESRPVREKIGIEIKDRVVYSGLPADELIKPLRRFVLDILERKVNSRSLHTLQDQADYVAALDRSSRPALSTKAAKIHSLPEIIKGAGKARRRTAPKPASGPASRLYLLPRKDRLNVSDPKVEAIATELMTLRVDKFPHAASVLFRVFLELSTDHHMRGKGLKLTYLRNGHPRDKTLARKIDEVIKDLVASGAEKKDFAAVQRGVSHQQSPLYIDLLHGYVHNRFVIPKIHDLYASWDESRPYFMAIWT